MKEKKLLIKIVLLLLKLKAWCNGGKLKPKDLRIKQIIEKLESEQ